MKRHLSKSLLHSICTGLVISFTAILLLSKEEIVRQGGNVEVIRGWRAVSSFMQHDPGGFLLGALLAWLGATIPAFVFFLYRAKRSEQKTEDPAGNP